MPLFWDTRLVPTNDPRQGITHRLIDVEGRRRDVLIGTPKGPQPIDKLRIHGTEVDCLADAGSELNLIARDCLREIVESVVVDIW